jgi:hypothetical protein
MTSKEVFPTLDLQTPKTMLDEPFLFPHGMSRYLIGAGLAALVIVATIVLVGRYESQRCLAGNAVLTDQDAGVCAR